jgi:hypothetical protein
MLSNEELQDEEIILHFLNELDEMQDYIKLENYTGYYDVENVKNFLEDFETLDDYYPDSISSLLRRNLQQWYNWRDEPFELPTNEYHLYGQKISSHKFSEITEHQNQKKEENFILVNHKAHNIPSPIEVTINKSITISTDSIINAQELFEWFTENRLPPRNFQIVEKHGENRSEGQMWRGRWASPLRCSKEHALELLKSAIGDEVRELFNRDYESGDHYIVFKFEGKNPQNMYHGYHVPIDSDEVPRHIKNKLAD